MEPCSWGFWVTRYLIFNLHACQHDNFHMQYSNACDQVHRCHLKSNHVLAGVLYTSNGLAISVQCYLTSHLQLLSQCLKLSCQFDHFPAEIINHTSKAILLQAHLEARNRTRIFFLWCEMGARLKEIKYHVLWQGSVLTGVVNKSSPVGPVYALQLS